MTERNDIERRLQELNSPTNIPLSYRCYAVYEVEKPLEVEKCIHSIARGMLETVKKLRWSPTIVHCHGWFSAVVPMYLKHVLYDDPLFRDVKIVLSLGADKFEGALSADFKQKLEGEGIMESKMSILEEPTYENLYRYVIDYADGIIVTSADADPAVLEYARTTGKKILEYAEGDAKEIFDNYKKFYDEL